MDRAIEIAGVRIRRALQPLRRPLRTGVGLFEKAPFLLIDLETRSGATGRLPGFTFHRLGLALAPPLIEDLVQLVAARPIALGDLPAVHDACQKRLTLLGHEGVAQLALSMLDMAIHDALARENGVPLYRLLGGRDGPIPAYNSCGLGIMEPKDAAREARELAGEHGGYGHVKMRLGRSHATDEVVAIAAVREAVGPAVMVSADFNQSLPATAALAACRAIDGLGLAWIEEPVAYDDYPAQARLARKLATPLQVGENWWSWRVGKAAIEAGACDYIMPDLLRIGGITGWMRLARVAEASAVPVSSHLSPEYSVHALAATATAHWLEYMDWACELIADPCVPERGVLRPGERPGTGIDWNERAIARVLVS
jgi:mandelate racemase